MSASRKLYRDDNPMISGVCGGIATRLDMDPVLIRVLAVLLTLCTLGAFVFLYAALWIILPRRMEERPLDASGTQPICIQDASPGGTDARIAKIALLVWAASTLVCFLFAALVFQRVFDVSWWSFWPLALANLGLVCVFFPLSHSESLLGFLAAFLLIATGAGLLPFTTGYSAWSDLVHAVSLFWPLLLIAAGMLLLAWGKDSTVWSCAGMGTIFCFILICVIGFGLPYENEEVVEASAGPAYEAQMNHDSVNTKAPPEIGVAVPDHPWGKEV